MDVKDFYSDSPEELIAQDPLEGRSSSRFLVLDKDTGEIWHRVLKSIVEYLRPGDCLVVNDTKMIPARLFGTKKGTGVKIEILPLKRRRNNIWETLIRSGEKTKPDIVIDFGEGFLTGTVIDTMGGGNRPTRFSYKGVFEETLDQLGQMSPPPYITRQPQDRNRCQTVYAKHEGSTATLTAGLHFTKKLLKQAEDMGMKIAHVTFHVGPGAFRPAKVENVLDHHMHSELCVVEGSEARKVNDTKTAGGRIICVRTTGCRAVEPVSIQERILEAKTGWMEIFIYPGYWLKVLDALITNFHLPESTPVMLVSALVGRKRILNAHQEVVREHYRFFSFGDAMFIASDPKTGNQWLQRV